MSKTSISWTDESLNPARGCTAISPGCLNCYAARHATRFSKPGLSFAGLARLKDQPPDANGRKRPKLAVWSGEVTLIPKALHEPLHWSPDHPKRVFVGSVTDMFHEAVPFEYIAALFAVMAATPWVTYQLVTKRPERMAEWFRWVDGQPTTGLVLGEAPPKHPVGVLVDAAAEYGVPIGYDRLHKLRGGEPAPWPLPNVHLLTSTENQETFDARVPHLLACPAVVHGVSAEPLLGPDRAVAGRHLHRGQDRPTSELPRGPGFPTGADPAGPPLGDHWRRIRPRSPCLRRRVDPRPAPAVHGREHRLFPQAARRARHRRRPWDRWGPPAAVSGGRHVRSPAHRRPRR